MKKIFGIVSFICITTFTHAQHDMSSMSGMSKPSTQITYTCPMHPEIHATKAGNCPKCGMALVKKKSAVLPKKEKASVLKSTDSSNHKGMDMQKTPSAGGSQPASYTCPMHPEIHSAQPGNCPKCGMKLVKEQPKTTTVEVEKMDMPSNGNETENMAHMSMAINAIDTLMGYKYIESAERPHIVRYDLYIKDTIVTYGNKRKRAIAANGQIPMPTLTFTEGDTAEIWVHNELNEETALHWHGLFVPNNMDGVPYLTQRPIKKHSTFIYKFPIKQHGTHWYHSHSKLQEQIGMYGSFIMNKRKEWSIPTIPVVISEWTNMKPEEVHRSLRSATDWFGIQKKSTQSYSEAINSGHLKTKLTNEWKRMNAMDVSDVYYDNFLVNGKNQNEQKQFIAGDKVRLRVANGGATDNFWLSYAGGKITIVATDGNDVEPVEVDRFLIAVSETFDLIVTIPENKSYEFLFTPEDRSKYASLWLGIGEKVAAKKLPRLKYFAGMKMMNEMMDTNGNMVEMEGMQMTNQVMDMNTVMYPEITGEEKPAEETGMKKDTIKNNNQGMPGMDMSSMNADIVTLNYTMLKAVNKTTLPEGQWKYLNFDLTGNMNRYVWSLNNKVVSESDRIFIKKGERVRIVLFNNSMMRHPMHLHGHDFRLVNGQGDYAPMKNIIDIMPMERDTIEFYAGEDGGNWFFHCHILYHMMSGMGRVITYENTPANPDLPDALARRKLNSDDKKFHLMGMVGIETNGSDGELMLSQTRWQIKSQWHLGYHDMHGYESETMVGRFLGRNQWWFPYTGFDYHYKTEGMFQKNFFDLSHSVRNIFGSEERNWFGQRSNKDNRRTIIAGVAYTLPTLTVADLRVDGNGKLRFQLSREGIPITPRMRFNWMLNTDKEYMAGFRYILTKYISFSTHYDSDMGIGAGITFTY